MQECRRRQNDTVEGNGIKHVSLGLEDRNGVIGWAGFHNGRKRDTGNRCDRIDVPLPHKPCANHGKSDSVFHNDPVSDSRLNAIRLTCIYKNI